MVTLKEKVVDLMEAINTELKNNGGKISPQFVNDYAQQQCTYEYAKVGDSCRVCVLTTNTGNKLVGYGLVLDSNNDDAVIGNKVARDEAVDQLWGFLGGVAKMLEV